jgi:hypothetical protein
MEQSSVISMMTEEQRERERERDSPYDDRRMWKLLGRRRAGYIASRTNLGANPCTHRPSGTVGSAHGPAVPSSFAIGRYALSAPDRDVCIVLWNADGNFFFCVYEWIVMSSG